MHREAEAQVDPPINLRVYVRGTFMVDPEKPFRPAHPNWSAKFFGDVLNNGHLRVFATRATWETAELHKTEALEN